MMNLKLPIEAIRKDVQDQIPQQPFKAIVKAVNLVAGSVQLQIAGSPSYQWYRCLSSAGLNTVLDGQEALVAFFGREPVVMGFWAKDPTDYGGTPPGTCSVSSTNFAGSPHTHAITSSSNPGAAASLLASDALGYLQLVGLGIGAAPGSADLHFATGVGITHADGIAAGMFLRANGVRYIPDTLDVADITDLAYAVPALTLGLANAAGAANTVIRTDATILAFDAVVPNVIQCDDAAATGAATVAARRDHEHGIVCDPPVNIGNANAEGTAYSFSRSDHVHDHPAALGTDLHHAEVHVVNSTGPHAEGGLTIGHVLRVTGAAAFSFGAIQAGDIPAYPAHNLLSATHGDTVVQGATRGSLVYGDATPAWNELVIGAASTHLESDGADVAWQVDLTMADGAYIGCDAVSPRIIFDDSNNNLELIVGTGAGGLGGFVLEGGANSPNIRGGLALNVITAGVTGATIAGGGLGLGWINTVTDDGGTIGGGASNQAGDGAGTTSDRVYATVGGGWYNRATGSYSAITGGSNNLASGSYSAIPGGHINTAQGHYSLAAGLRAKTGAFDGVFIWGDSTNADFDGIAANEFALRARGGFRHAYDNSNYWTAQVSAAGAVTFDATGAGAAFAFSDNVGIGMAPTANGLLCLGTPTENFEVIDAGSVAATEQDWIECEIGGAQGYLRVYAAK